MAGVAGKCRTRQPRQCKRDLVTTTQGIVPLVYITQLVGGKDGLEDITLFAVVIREHLKAQCLELLERGDDGLLHQGSKLCDVRLLLRGQEVLVGVEWVVLQR